MRKFISVIIIISVLVFSVPINTLAVTTVENLKAQINDINLQKEAIDREIIRLQDQITQTSNKSNSLVNTIKGLTLTRSKLLKEKDLTQKKINEANLVIKELSIDIKTKEILLQNSEKSLLKMINLLNETDNKSFLEKLLSQESISDMSNEYNKIITLNEKIRENINDLQSKKIILNTSKNKKEDEQKNLNNLKTSLTLKQQVVESTKKEQDSLLVTTKNKESEYKKLLAEQIKRRDAFEKSLASYEAQLKFILNPGLKSQALVYT